MAALRDAAERGTYPTSCPTLFAISYYRAHHLTAQQMYQPEGDLAAFRLGHRRSDGVAHR